MGVEIEHKFLVRDDAWRAAADAGVVMRQGYLAGTGKASIRVRVAGGQGYLNIKSAGLAVRRREYEYPIPVSEAQEILNHLCEDAIVEKTRYHVRHSGHVWEVDVFAGDNSGLVVAEIELDREGEPFERPAWAGEEVSHDPRYYNVYLAKHPYRTWQRGE